MKWSRILEKKEDQILEAIKKAYRKACDASRDIDYTVEVDRDGEIHICEYIGNSMSESVWKGESLEVTRIKGFDPTDGDDFSWFPESDATLTEDEKQAFITWCKEQDADPTPYALEEWNPELYEKWRKNYIESYLDAYEDNFAEEEFRTSLEIAREKEEFEEVQF